MQLGEKLRMLRTQRNLTLDAVGDALDTSRQNIYKYESGIITNIPLDKIEKLARLYHVTPASLLGWDEPDSTDDTDTDTVDIPIYGSVPAGVPVEAIEDIDGTVQIPADWLRGGKQYIALRVHGDSMYPRYLDGDIVIIRLAPEFVGGKDSVVYVNGYEATLKTVHTYTPGQITLQPVNPMYPTKHYGPGDDPVTCLGHVVELRRTIQ